MNESIINGIFTLAGVVIGFGLTYITTWWQGRQQAKAVRTLLAIEIEYNLNVLKTYWNKLQHTMETVRADKIFVVNDQALYDNDPDLCMLDQSIQRTYTDQPIWHTSYLNSQLPVLATALAPKEIAAIHIFYTRLGHISHLINNHMYAQIVPNQIRATREIQQVIKQALQQDLPLKQFRA